MNKTVLLGRLTKDPEVRYTPSQKVVAQFTLAVDRPYLSKEGKREADFIPVIIWGKPAELIGNSLSKGQRILIEGRIQTRTYDDQNGQRHWVTEVVASDFEYIERKGDGGASAPASHSKQESPMANMGEDVPFDEEIPF